MTPCYFNEKENKTPKSFFAFEGVTCKLLALCYYSNIKQVEHKVSGCSETCLNKKPETTVSHCKQTAKWQMAHLVLPDIQIVIGTDSSQNQKSRFFANVQ
jgi:hypothetical protein